MPAWILPAAMALGSLASQWFGARKQAKENKELAQFQADANEKYLKEQQAYNTPASQMARFQDAGLNPHLIYGQGNPGNQSEPLRFPEIGRADYQRLGEALPLINQSALAQSQVQAQEARTRKDAVMTEVAKVQKAVLEKNPLLDPVGFKAMIDSLTSAAEIKATEAKTKFAEYDWMWNNKFASEGKTYPLAVQKVLEEIQLLEQRFKLGSIDGKIKAEVLNSKEFQNAILEVQKKFLSDGEIGPQQIMQFISILLMKAL